MVWEDKSLDSVFERKGEIKGIVSHRLVRLEFVAESRYIERRDWRRCRRDEVRERDTQRQRPITQSPLQPWRRRLTLEAWTVIFTSKTGNDSTVHI